MSPRRQVQALEEEKAGLEVQLQEAQHEAAETQQRVVQVALERHAARTARKRVEEEVCMSSVTVPSRTFHLQFPSLCLINLPRRSYTHIHY
jgi:hypothetical protein